MNLEQVKEHFKNAKEVKCASDGKIFNIDVEGRFDADYSHERVDFDFEKKQKGERCVALFIDNKLAEIISYKDTPQEPEENEYPKEGKVMLVSHDEIEWLSRVVFMEKNDLFIAWFGAVTIEAAKETVSTISWKYAKELPKEVEVTKEEIAKWKGCDVEQLIIK